MSRRERFEEALDAMHRWAVGFYRAEHNSLAMYEAARAECLRLWDEQRNTPAIVTVHATGVPDKVIQLLAGDTLYVDVEVERLPQVQRPGADAERGEQQEPPR